MASTNDDTTKLGNVGETPLKRKITPSAYTARKDELMREIKAIREQLSKKHEEQKI